MPSILGNTVGRKKIRFRQSDYEDLIRRCAPPSPAGNVVNLREKEGNGEKKERKSEKIPDKPLTNEQSAQNAMITFWKILKEQFQIEKEVVIGNDTNRR